MSEMIERVARALMAVTARRPAQTDDDSEFPVLASDPDFDDLPIDHTQGTVDDEITQEAVLLLARAAIAAMREPTESMVAEGSPHIRQGWRDIASEIWRKMIDASLTTP